jgi:hypothetical protein
LKDLNRNSPDSRVNQGEFSINIFLDFLNTYVCFRWIK